MILGRLPVVCATLLALAASTGAGPRPADAQVPAEQAASVLLDAATAFEADGRSDVAVAIYELIVRQYPGTFVADEARRRLEGAAATGDPGDGRTELMVWSTTYGLFLGVAFPTALGASTAPPYGVGLLLGGPGGFLAGRAIAGSRPITLGQARAVTWAGTWGTWQGAGWRDVLDIGEEEVCDAFGFCYSAEDTIEETFAAMIVGGVAGILIGGTFAQRDISPGTATAVNFGSLWGTWFGFATGVLLGWEEDALLASTLVGGDVGLLYTAIMAPRWNVTRNRARMVSIAGVIGLLGGAGLDLIIEPDDEKVAVGVPLATSIIGLAFGAAATAGSGASGPGQDEGADWSGALLSTDGNGWRLDAPLPFPLIRERPSPRGMERRAALGLTLLSVTF